MSAAAVFMMLVTILLVWGGLVASIVALKAFPNSDDAEMTVDDASDNI